MKRPWWNSATFWVPANLLFVVLNLGSIVLLLQTLDPLRYVWLFVYVSVVMGFNVACLLAWAIGEEE